jgi:hypothetical protein
MPFAEPNERGTEEGGERKNEKRRWSFVKGLEGQRASVRRRRTAGEVMGSCDAHGFPAQLSAHAQMDSIWWPNWLRKAG